MKNRSGAEGDGEDFTKPAVKTLSVTLSADGSIFVMDKKTAKEIVTTEQMYMLIETLMKYFRNNAAKKGTIYE